MAAGHAALEEVVRELLLAAYWADFPRDAPPLTRWPRRIAFRLYYREC